MRVLPIRLLVPAVGRGGGVRGRGGSRGGLDAVRGRGTAGTTNCGAVDPLDGLADLCAAEGLWFHVDGAYGAAARLCEPGRALAGIDRADSLVIDPHKWLFQPYEAGAVLIREPGLLERTFTLSGEYLRDTFGGEVNFRDRGIQLTRGVRALKLWLSVEVFGLDAFRDAVAHGIALAEHAEAVLRARGRLGDRHAGAARDRLLRARAATSCRPPRCEPSATATPHPRRPCSEAAPCCGCAPSTRARPSRTSRHDRANGASAD